MLVSSINSKSSLSINPKSFSESEGVNGFNISSETRIGDSDNSLFGNPGDPPENALERQCDLRRHWLMSASKLMTSRDAPSPLDSLYQDDL